MTLFPPVWLYYYVHKQLHNNTRFEQKINKVTVVNTIFCVDVIILIVKQLRKNKPSADLVPHLFIPSRAMNSSYTASFGKEMG